MSKRGEKLGFRLDSIADQPGKCFKLDVDSLIRYFLSIPDSCYFYFRKKPMDFSFNMNDKRDDHMHLYKTTVLYNYSSRGTFPNIDYELKKCTTVIYDICAGETGACQHHADTTCKRVEDNYAEDSTEQPWDMPNMGGGGDNNNNDNKDKKPKIEIIKTELTEKFPCATLLVINKLEEIPAYNKMVEPFITLNYKPNLTWKVSDQPWQDGMYSAGNTGRSQNSGLGASSDINLNSHLLQKGSQLLIAATAIHETYHAYINYMFVYNNRLDLADKCSPSYMAGMVQYILYTKGPNNLSDHYNMISSQFENMTNILYAYGNQKYSEQECRMALLFGLDNAGESSSDGEKAFIKQSYQKLIEKYGFTEQSVKQFTLEQINPTPNKKLPNNCN